MLGLSSRKSRAVAHHYHPLNTRSSCRDSGTVEYGGKGIPYFSENRIGTQRHLIDNLARSPAEREASGITEYRSQSGIPRGRSRCTCRR